MHTADARSGLPLVPCDIQRLRLLLVNCPKQRRVYAAPSAIPQPAIAQTRRTNPHGSHWPSQGWQNHM